MFQKTTEKTAKSLKFSFFFNSMCRIVAQSSSDSVVGTEGAVDGSCSNSTTVDVVS